MALGWVSSLGRGQHWPNPRGRMDGFLSCCSVFKASLTSACDWHRDPAGGSVCLAAQVLTWQVWNPGPRHRPPENKCAKPPGVRIWTRALKHVPRASADWHSRDRGQLVPRERLCDLASGSPRRRLLSPVSPRGRDARLTSATQPGSKSSSAPSQCVALGAPLPPWALCLLGTKEHPPPDFR